MQAVWTSVSTHFTGYMKLTMSVGQGGRVSCMDGYQGSTCQRFQSAAQRYAGYQEINDYMNKTVDQGYPNDDWSIFDDVTKNGGEKTDSLQTDQ